MTDAFAVTGTSCPPLWVPAGLTKTLPPSGTLSLAGIVHVALISLLLSFTLPADMLTALAVSIVLVNPGGSVMFQVCVELSMLGVDTAGWLLARCSICARASLMFAYKDKHAQNANGSTSATTCEA